MFSPRKTSFPNLATAHHQPSGQIQIIFGPMFSGKTYELANYECVVVKYAKDVRYSPDQLATHDKQMLKAISATTLAECKEQLMKHQVIAIDEGQFFPDLALAEELANQHKVVIIAALDGDFRREGFQNVISLVPKAENVVKLNAVCMVCYQDAAYTKRTSSDTAIEVIGGPDMYLAVCRVCHERTRSPGKAASENEPVLFSTTIKQLHLSPSKGTSDKAPLKEGGNVCSAQFGGI